MKRYIKKAFKKVAPSVVADIEKLHSIDKKLTSIIDELSNNKHDFRLDRLKELLSRVEPYQPIYGLTGLIDTPARTSLDRCRAIEQYLDGQIIGKRFLDIGSSLGYMCFFFADRGAKSEGWEMNVDNAEASRAAGDLNGISIDIKTKSFDDQTVGTIRETEYDVITILSVIHHIIHYNGLEYTQRLMAEVVRKTPTLFVELAKKGEDKSLFWDAAQPEDELSVFDLIKDEVTIKKIGEFGNHLSKNKRPLYVVEQKKTIKVNDKKYIYNKVSSQAYDFSEAARHNEKRRYYWTNNSLIKEYMFERGKTDDNARLIINEIACLFKTKDIQFIPKMIDYEVSNNGAKIVYELIKGEAISTRQTYSDDALMVIYNDLLGVLKELHGIGIYHNDIRTWNVLYDGKHAFIIDLAQASGIDEDHDLIALMWVMSSLYKGVRESTEMAKLVLPSIKDVPGFLKKDFLKIKSGASEIQQLGASSVEGNITTIS